MLTLLRQLSQLFFFEFTTLYELSYWPMQALRYSEVPKMVRKTMCVHFGLNLGKRRVTIIKTKHIEHYPVKGRYVEAKDVS